MKKEISIVALLLAAVLLFVYLFNLQFTGFAVSEQTSDFSLGQKVNTTLSGSSLVLAPNETTGTYTSQVFDSNDTNTTWNNLTLIGQGNITFEVTTCSDENCSDASFTMAESVNNTVELTNMSGQYFQYRATLTSDINVTTSLESVTLAYNVPEEPSGPIVSVSISEPSGEKSTASEIPLKFNIEATGNGAENLTFTCLYDVLDSSDSASIISNTTIANCENDTVFNLGAGEGSYTFNLYVNSSEGFHTKTTSFSVSLVSASNPEETPQETTPIESTIQVPVMATQQPKKTELIASDIASVSSTSAETIQETWTVSNTGTVPLSACHVVPQGELDSWLSVSEDSTNLNPGDSHDFAFSVLIPVATESGEYILSVSLECAETAASKDFSVSITPAETSQATPVGGFAIFGENGIGTGGAIIIVIVALSLVAIFLVARKMRREGKTLKDVLNNLGRKE